MAKKLIPTLLTACMVLFALGCTKVADAPSGPPANLVQQGTVPQNVLDAATPHDFGYQVASTTFVQYASMDDYVFGSDYNETSENWSGKKRVAKVASKYPDRKVYPLLFKLTQPVLNKTTETIVLAVDTGVADRPGNYIYLSKGEPVSQYQGAPATVK